MIRPEDLPQLDPPGGPPEPPPGLLNSVMATVRRRRVRRRLLAGSPLVVGAVVAAVFIPDGGSNNGTSGLRVAPPAATPSPTSTPTSPGSFRSASPGQSATGPTGQLTPTAHPTTARVSTPPASAGNSTNQTAPSTTTATQPAACTTPQLDYVASAVTVAYDDYRQVVTVTNRSTRPCAVRGMPDVVLVQANGSQYAGGQQFGGDGTTGTPSPVTIDLPPQASASFAVDLGRQKVSNNQQFCEPVDALDVTIPGAQQRRVAISAETCAGPSERGSRNVSNIVPGRDGPPIG